MTSPLRPRSLWLIVLTVFTAAAIFLVSKIHLSPSALPVYGTVEDFSLTERSGKKVTLADLKGRVWIADFIFTRCGGICPMMSAKMRTLQEHFKNQPGIRFVSFSVDPERDTPQVLTKYATHFNADTGKWLFLTGDKEQLFNLSEQHFHLGVSDIPLAEREAPDQSVNHSSKFALVDGQGKIRGYYASEEEASLGQLQKDAERLLK